MDSRSSAVVLDDAIAAFEAALFADPSLVEAESNLGTVLVRAGHASEGVAHLRDAVSLDPDNVGARYNLGIGLKRTGAVDEAVSALREVISADPKRIEAYDQLGIALASAGQYADAVATFRAGLAESRRNTKIANQLAWLLATCPDADIRNGGEAVELARELCRATGHGAPLLLDTLAAAQAETGDFTAALQTASRAIDLAQPRRSDLWIASSPSIRNRVGATHTSAH